MLISRSCAFIDQVTACFQNKQHWGKPASYK